MNKQKVIKFLEERLKESESYKKTYDKKINLSFPDDLSLMSTIRDIESFKAAIHYISNDNLMDIEVVDPEEVIAEEQDVYENSPLKYLEIDNVEYTLEKKFDYIFDDLTAHELRLVDDTFEATKKEAQFVLDNIKDIKPLK